MSSPEAASSKFEGLLFVLVAAVVASAAAAAADDDDKLDGEDGRQSFECFLSIKLSLNNSESASSVVRCDAVFDDFERNAECYEEDCHLSVGYCLSKYLFVKNTEALS